ncbi:Hypp5320 [Branchiostoma lanceolatum]|uniref:Hypp5320 protein n=1 Tax=Branchiostoma lanceolatum TaxID=7740 RepID=A0A8K0AEH2_BRALA|nr:Hypp5320 [Branchiostoma lanceolatum]
MAAGSEWSKHHSRMPRFNMKEKTYEQYRFELECWNAVTTLGKTRRGIEIMLSLPEGQGEDEYSTREFLSSRLSMPELTSETSFANVLAKLDEHLRVDETGRLWDSFAAFDQFSRGSLTMSEYISKFDILYNTLNKCGNVTLPASVLGLLLQEVHVAEQQTFQASRGRYVPGATGQYKPGRYKSGRARVAVVSGFKMAAPMEVDRVREC